jgi:hypothetical protein
MSVTGKAKSGEGLDFLHERYAEYFRNTKRRVGITTGRQGTAAVRKAKQSNKAVAKTRIDESSETAAIAQVMWQRGSAGYATKKYERSPR